MSEEPDAMLVVEKGMPGVKAIPLEEVVCLVGASPTADVFVDNPYISRMHAQIIKDGRHRRIRDLDSKNGTFVNGTRVTGEGHLLRDGDRIQLAEGQVFLRYHTRSSTLTLRSSARMEEAGLLVDSKPREVWVGGQMIEPPLSRKEFDVLNLLFRRRGEACSKDDIAAAGWPERGAGDVGDQEIEQTIRRIRLRIESDPSKPQYITTVRGYGYKLPLEKGEGG
jgi:pSer/pThr/pTyr-binding forkhead associated (FHA) protein